MVAYAAMNPDSLPMSFTSPTPFLAPSASAWAALNRCSGLRYRRVETERGLHKGDVVVNGLRDADHSNLQSAAADFFGDGLGSTKRAVPSDRKEDPDVHPIEGIHHLGVVLRTAGRSED